MKRDDGLRTIAAHKGKLNQLGAVNIAIFGSVARDAARPDSDVDVLIDLARPMGLFGLVDVKDYLEQILGCEST